MDNVVDTVQKAKKQPKCYNSPKLKVYGTLSESVRGAAAGIGDTFTTQVV